ncbi:MAG: type II toxin-antitoxin system RelE/ParE family toxin [Pseudorhodoplanes sp.]|nr:type II toxin-antitoxin system RelE/ParE family toxin [Pseudorhodoplanes sp.]
MHRVRFTDEALRDLDGIADYLANQYPGLGAAVELRIRIIVAHIRRWPESARRSAGRPDIRVVPLGRFPYRIFYRVLADTVEILHIHHAAREPWDETERPD